MEVLATGEALAAADLTTGGEMEGALEGPGVTERGALGLQETGRVVSGLPGRERGGSGIGTKQIDPKKGWRICVNVLLCRKCF